MENAPGPLPKRARAGRRISAAGLGGLAVAFFLPQVPGCESDIVPAREFATDLWPAFFLFYFAFATLGLYLLRALFRTGRAHGILSHVAAAATVAVFIIYDWLWALWLRGDTLDWSWMDLAKRGLILSAGAGTLAAAWIWVRAPAKLRMPLCVSLTGIVSLFYVLFFASLDHARPGLWLSIASCALLSIGGPIEVFALRRAQRSISTASTSS